MKFGKVLNRALTPEWSRYYVSYKVLKQQLKHAKTLFKKDSRVDANNAITNFFFTLDRELEKINSFYLYKQAELERRVKLYTERHRVIIANRSRSKQPGLEKDSAESEFSMLTALTETKLDLERLLRFATVNHEAMRKILKKWDKHMVPLSGMECVASNYMETKVDVLPFATPQALNVMLEAISALLKELESTGSTVQDRIQELAQERTTSQTSFDEEFQAPDQTIRTLLSFLKTDDAVSLSKELDQLQSQNSTNQSGLDRLFAHLLTRACYRKALECVTLLIKRNAPTKSVDDINERTLLHKLIIHGGRLSDSDLTPILPLPTNVSPNLKTERAFDDPFLIEHILEPMQGNSQRLRDSLFSRDLFGRVPLHYAALTGQHSIAKVLVRAMKQVEELNGCARSRWFDYEGYSPFSYAVLKGHVEVLDVLIRETGLKDVDVVVSASEPHEPTVLSNAPLSSPVTGSPSFLAHVDSHTPLALACKYGHAKIVQLLVSFGANVNYGDADGETPLHLACRGGHAECVRILLEQPGINVNTKERFYGWSPLFLAAIDGHAVCCQLLLHAGADAKVVDLLGWNAHEHAVFRAHTDVAALLHPYVSPYPLKPIKTNNTLTILNRSPKKQRSNLTSMPERAYGHKYLQDRSLIVVYLGTTDRRKPVIPVNLDEKRLKGSIISSSYSLTIAAKNAQGEPAIVDLPLQESVIEPISFYADVVEDVILTFDIEPTFGSKKQLIGRATAMLSTPRTSLREERTSLGGSVTVPIIEAGSMEVVGTVTFEYVVIHPFSHKNMRMDITNTYWKSVETTVIGHRGSGANRLVKGFANLQLGENTLLSFVTAANLGAEYVEFDVQLTKDGVPVLYHDWTLTESGFDIPVHSVTLKQFMDLHPPDAPAGRYTSTKFGHRSRESSVHRRAASASSLGIGRGNLARSNSMMQLGWKPIIEDVDEEDELVENWGGKGNSFGTIQAPFATLKDTFQSVPNNIGFNIEIKYPWPSESEEYNLNPAELNIYVDKILECVFEYAGDRNIIFSSFHPEVCMMVNLKQCNYPVFFLTEAGTIHTSDVRCSSLQEAVRFAKSSDLLGIVADSRPLIEAPNLIRGIKETGLLLFTYGSANNAVENAMLQREYGVDAVIVDSVAKVRKGLQFLDESTADESN